MAWRPPRAPQSHPHVPPAVCGRCRCSRTRAWEHDICTASSVIILHVLDARTSCPGFFILVLVAPRLVQACRSCPWRASLPFSFVHISCFRVSPALTTTMSVPFLQPSSCLPSSILGGHDHWHGRRLTRPHSGQAGAAVLPFARIYRNLRATLVQRAMIGPDWLLLTPRSPSCHSCRGSNG